MPVLPRVVTQPIMPSAYALHFMRVRPVPSCFLPQVRTSSSSPGFNFRVLSLTLEPTLEPPSISKHSVMIVSFTTLKTPPPSSKKLMPAVLATDTQPSRSSFRALARTLLSSPSLTGPSNTSTASPTSKRRTDLASVKLNVSVNATSLITFMSLRSEATNVSSDTDPLFSSSRVEKARTNSSSAMSSPSFSLSTLGALTRKAANLSLSKVSAPPATFLKSSAGVSFSEAMKARRRAIAVVKRAWTSAWSCLEACALKLRIAVFARVIMLSTFFFCATNLVFSTLTQFCKSLSTSSPPNFSTSSTAAWSFSSALLVASSNSSAFLIMSADFMSFAFWGRVLI
mmetsp:Transcript_48328/g.155774  ORF Transcript_48328/g.155774 Transcript_48328/m.155774 type:complete len:341 (-) Transcript_48328:1407-2429(-)